MPDISGQFLQLSLEDFNATFKGEFFHFVDRFNSAGNPIMHSQPTKNGNNPIELVNQGITTRDYINNLFTTFGDPLFGIFISAGGGQFPHTAFMRTDFNPLMPNGPKTPDNVQIGMETSLELLYKDEQTVDDPEDPDDGQTFDLRGFWAVTHFFEHVNNGLYDINTDYKLMISNDNPPGDWWKL